MIINPTLIAELVVIAAPIAVSVIEAFKLRKWQKIADAVIGGVESAPIPEEHKITIKEAIAGSSLLAGVAEKLHVEVKKRTRKPVLK